MDDTRIEWIRNKIYDGLRITDPSVFDSLLNRDDGRNDTILTDFLNNTGAISSKASTEGKSVVFYISEVEEEEEVEIEIGELLFYVNRTVNWGDFGCWGDSGRTINFKTILHLNYFKPTTLKMQHACEVNKLSGFIYTCYT